MEVIFLEDGMISVGGSVIPMDSGMYCLSCLREVLEREGLYGKDFSRLLNEGGMATLLSYYYGRSIDRSIGVVRELRRLGLYRQTGVGYGRRQWCSKGVFLLLLSRYCPETLCGLLRVLD